MVSAKVLMMPAKVKRHAKTPIVSAGKSFVLCDINIICPNISAPAYAPDATPAIWPSKLHQPLTQAANAPHSLPPNIRAQKYNAPIVGKQLRGGEMEEGRKGGREGSRGGEGGRGGGVH